MKKLKIGIFFSLYFKAPHNNKDAICAPMILVQELAELLNKKGHEAHLLVAKDSQKAPYFIRSSRFSSISKNKFFNELIKQGNNAEKTKLSLLYNEIALKEYLKKYGNKLAILHLHHIDYIIPALLEKDYKFQIVLTAHDPITLYYQKMLEAAISLNPKIIPCFLTNSQAKNIKIKNKKIINNGIDLSLYPFNDKPKNHLAFAGRLIKEKGVLTAISVAKQTKNNIHIAGDEPNDKNFWLNELQPKIKQKNVTYIGKLAHNKMSAFYRDARAFLFPIECNEPFGLVMIESMASGTPVIAFDKGSPREIIKHGITGFIVKNEKEMIKAVKKIYSMPQEEYMAMRRAARAHVEENFSIKKMADNYENLYYKIINSHHK